MRDLSQRYLAGVVRVILLKKDGLQTIADDTRFAEQVQRDGDWTVVDEAQGVGAKMRSVTIPVAVWMSEEF